jgi:cell division protein FtsQ
MSDIGFLVRARVRRMPAMPWRTRKGAVLTIAASTIFVAGFCGWLWRQGVPQHIASVVNSAVAKSTAEAGLAVGEVFVIGRQHADREDLLAALQVERGDPILFVDLDEARSRVSALSWVADASVERLLPNIIVLHLQERSPLALWQSNGRFSVIDAEGYVLAQDDVARYADLTLVVGDQAPEEAADFVHMISSQPELAGHVKAGVRVSGRRWDVHLKPGVRVLLPEESPHGAWAELAQYHREHRLLEKQPKVIDLRIPGRVTIEPVPRETADVNEEQGA